MCGIYGVYNFNKNMPVSRLVLNEMNQLLTHRGPDDNGIYAEEFLGLGHTRLSIIDIDNGKQPMSNEDKSIWITYNGEIYNFKDIKKFLTKKGHLFTTNCDTEAIIHSYEEYGFDCVSKLNGMFAFAIWDQKNEILFLSRDRLGVKPLYYCISDGNFIFASEIKAILKHPVVKATIEINSIPEYLFCTTLLNGNTMFKDIYSVPPGHMIIFKDGKINLIQYWDLKMEDDLENIISFEQYKSDISGLIKDSVQMRLMSDVPFGSLLSGGLDSSLISAIAAKYVNYELKTFSMEYSKNSELGNSNSDTKYAWLMAKTFETNHKEFIFQPEDYQGILEKVIWHVEKPIELTTPSLYLLYNKLKSDVTVVLSGEGADELFGGYYFFLNEAPINQLTNFPWVPYFKEVITLLDSSFEKETRFCEKYNNTLFEIINRFDTDDHLNKILYLFIKFYLLEMLERQDKTSMAWGIEARVPYLDYRLVEYVARIPSRYKMKTGIEKFILKEIAKEILPSEIVERKKKPFPFPIDPKSIYNQKNIANNLVQSGNSKISCYFDRKVTNDFFNKKNQFAGIDNLAIFRTSYAMIVLELWHKVFGV